MMHIDIFNNGHVQGQPKSEIKIESLKVTPYPDRFRLYIEIEVTPFQERPNLLLVLRDETGERLEDLSVIATMHAKMEFTMHLRGMDDPAGSYVMDAELFYETRKPPQDTASFAFDVPMADETSS